MSPSPDYGVSTYRGSGKLTGKVALITGGDSGIGRAVALAFAREGADIVISYLDEDEDAQQIVADVEETGQRIVAIAGDIVEPSHCRSLIERTMQEFGRLDVLVNNAAFQRTYEQIGDIDVEEFDHHFNVNVRAMFVLCQSAVPHMQPGAAIINVASIQAYNPSPTLLAYASTKGAIVTFSKGLAHSLIEQGIRVNVVAPGPVWTPLIPATIPPEHASKFGQDAPIGRPAQPAELAPAFVYLASDDASYVIGQVIGVTGGKFIA